MCIQKNLLTKVMLVWYEFPNGTICSSNIRYNKQLKTSGSPILFLQDILYGDKDLPEEAIPHLLNVDAKYRILLYTVLCKYRNVFPSER